MLGGAAYALRNEWLYLVHSGRAPGAGWQAGGGGCQHQISLQLFAARCSIAGSTGFDLRNQFLYFRNGWIIAVSLQECVQSGNAFLVTPKVSQGFPQSQLGGACGAFSRFDCHLSLLPSFFELLLLQVGIREKVVRHPVRGICDHGLLQSLTRLCRLSLVQLLTPQQNESLDFPRIQSYGALQVCLRLLHVFQLQEQKSI